MRLALAACGLACVLAQPPVQGAPGKRGWMIADIVEISEIAGVAISADEQRVAFVLKQPSIASGNIEYALYVMSPQGEDRPAVLTKAQYMADLSPNPGAPRWTIRADFGAGVQLYDIDNLGNRHALVTVADTVTVGGTDGAIRNAFESPRETGVLSYAWSPDGEALWYAKPRINPPAARQALSDKGLVYDSRTMHSFAFRKDTRRGSGPAAGRTRARRSRPAG